MMCSDEKERGDVAYYRQLERVNEMLRIVCRLVANPAACVGAPEIMGVVSMALDRLSFLYGALALDMRRTEYADEQPHEAKETMPFDEAVKVCHVRSSTFRASRPTVKYPKNHRLPPAACVPLSDQSEDDWREWDPNDQSGISLGAESDNER